MENLFGKIKASLDENDRTNPADLINILNNNISPPEKISANDVYIRAMYIVSDAINSYGGCFPVDEHELLLKLIIDSPVLIGHRKDSLPIARNFYAERVQKGGANWVKVYFYWLKSAEGAESLKNNIDGGIYKECSISFVFSFPECSVCGDDIRRCGHRPFKEYQAADGAKKEAYFNYRRIEKILETSIVYRGSVHDTSLTNELYFTIPVQSENNSEQCKFPAEQNYKPAPIYRIWKTKQLNADNHYLVMPAYEGIRCVLIKSGGILSVDFGRETNISNHELNSCLRNLNLPDGNYGLDGRLIGYHGKERQTVEQLIKFLCGKRSKVTRIELKIYDLLPDNNVNNVLPDIFQRRQRVSEILGANCNFLVPAESVPGSGLPDTVAKVSTRYGAEIINCSTGDRFLLSKGKRIPLKVQNKEEVAGGFKYSLAGHVSESEMIRTSPVFSKKCLNTNDSIEIEVSSFVIKDSTIELVQPKIADLCDGGLFAENIERLTRPDADPLPVYTIYQQPDKAIQLKIEDVNDRDTFIVRNFSLSQLTEAKRFLTDKVKILDNNHGQFFGRGNILQSRLPGQTRLLELDGFLIGTFTVRPMVINGRDRYLFYKMPDGMKAGATGERQK